MKTSTKDRIKGSFHEVKGTIREQVGKATNDRTLKAEGKAERSKNCVGHSEMNRRKEFGLGRVF